MASDTQTGRTGRIGHRGLASSFYNDRDEPIASVLTRTLLETDQEIPDFLQSYVPEGASATNLKFEADSDFEEDVGAGGDAGGDIGGTWRSGDADAGNAGNDAGGDTWGGGNDAGGDTWGNGGGDSWGASNTQAVDTTSGW